MLASERMQRQRIETAQVRQLRRLVEHAFERVPGYRSLWQAHGVAPKDVQSLSDLERLPIIDKSYMLDIGSKQFVDRRDADMRGLLPRYTSGSSGVPFEFFIDRKYNQWRKAQRLRPYVSNGLKPWHRVLAVSAGEGDAPRLPAKLGIFAERRVSAARPAAELLRTLNALRPDAIIGYPSALRLLAAESLASGGVARRPALVFTDSEVLTPRTRTLLREAFGTEPIDVYGTFETDNIAFECRAHAGLHVAMESAILEIVGPEGRPVTGDVSGEVVVTVLRNTAMPFIRYNLHDVSAYRATACDCGRTLPMLGRVHGRRDDYISLQGGEQCPAMPLLLEFDSLTEWLREYRIVQRAIGDFELHVRSIDGLSESHRRLMGEIFDRHVPGARLSFVEHLGGVPREPSGKLRCFVSAVAD
jgi:phenylacetate-CoA ligase